MSIASAIQLKQQQVAAAYTACDEKGATMPAAGSQNLSNLADTIATISGGGGGGGEENFVEFVDYDGTLIQKMTLTEAKALTTLPEGPAHAGLTFDGWSASLLDIQAITGYNLTIGPLFITTDGKTHLDCHIPYDGFQLTISYYQNTANGVVVDWGDNSDTFSQAAAGGVTTSHTYSVSGDYTIKLECVAGAWKARNEFTPIITNSEWQNRVLRHMRIGNSLGSTEGICMNKYSLETVTIPNYLNAFADRSFQNCYSLKYATLKTTVSLLYAAFDNTTSLDVGYLYFNSLATLPTRALNKSLIKGVIFTALTSIQDASDGAGAFDRCSHLKYIVFPDSLSVIGSYVCYYCSSLTDIVFPNAVTAVNMRAFEYCDLSNVEVPSTITTLGQDAFSVSNLKGTLHLPNLTSIGIYAFTNTKLEKVTSLGSITTLPGTATANGVFANCSNLESVVLPSTLTSIGYSAFYNCTSLKTCVIPDSVTNIGKYAFRYDRKYNPNIPPDIAVIDDNAFDETNGIGKLTLSSSSLTILDYTTFRKTGYSEIEITSPITTANSSNSSNPPFRDCPNLVSVSLPSTLTVLCGYMFNGCQMLRDITFSPSLTKLSTNCLRLTSLKSITIPSTVTSIEADALYETPYLDSIIIEATTPPTLGSNRSLGGSANLVITVPAGTLSAYQSASNWSAYASKMVEAS